MEIFAFLAVVFSAISAFFFRPGGFYNPRDEETPEPEPIVPPEPVKEEPAGYKWDTPSDAYLSTRLICDEMGLTLQQKNIVCACIYQESNFYNYLPNGQPVKNENKRNGVVWSTDWGLVQVNDTKGWHIGPKLRFKSVQDVLDNPEKAVRWMVSVMKETGGLQPWSSYTSRAYTQWLSPASPMWKLKKV